VQMLLVLSSTLFSPHNAQIASLAIEHRLPAMFILKSYVEAGSTGSRLAFASQAKAHATAATTVTTAAP
jgi:hypothetical protein